MGRGLFLEPMAVGNYLEVDVNGEEVFWVDKGILSSFSGKLSKLFNRSSATAVAKALKVILHDLPGGPDTFEVLTRFCYNQGKIEITPANTCLLNFAAHFMEMTEDVASSPNLVKQTEQLLEATPYWSWTEIATALRQCQDYFSLANSSGVFEKLLDSLANRISSASETSPSNSSPESTGFRFSFDTRSTISTRNSSQRAWWFEDLAVLSSDVIQKVGEKMVSRKLDHCTLNRFLLYYIKTRTSNVTSAEKKKIIEAVIDILYSLERTSLASKGLFGILRLSLPLNLSENHRSKLDSMIGSQIDQATLDNLLVPSPPGTGSLYDVNLVLRFLKSFLSNGGKSSTTRLKRVGSLIDLYLAEVAPDPCLKTQKFVSLAMALPDSARDSHDGIYRAIDMYIEVHSGLCEEEKMRICCVLNYEKLSSETCKHLAENPKFPSRTAIQALVSQQSKLKNLLHDTNIYKTPQSSPLRDYNKSDQIILYAKKLDQTHTENEKLKAHLQGMQWRVMELEKICRKLQNQMAKIMKSGLSSSRSTRSLPKLCS